MNIGNWIVVSFVLFAIFIGTLVVVCMKQEISLVSPDYYQRELNHQEKIDQAQNTASLTVKPEITMVANSVEIYFPQFNQVEKGEFTLLRPSDQRLDHRFQLQLTQDSLQRFPLRVWEQGLYRASLQWTMGGKDYYLEHILVK